MNELFRVGVVSTAHGIKGALKVFPTTEDPARFKDLEKVFFSKKADEAENLRELTVTEVAFSGGQVLVSTAEITDRNEAELMRGGSLWVDRAHAIALEEGEIFYADFIGGPVVSDEGEDLGTLTEVIELACNDVLVVNKGAEELLIPFIRDCIVKMDPEKPEIVVHLLPGIRD